MAKYITLLDYTHDGVMGFGELSQRLADARSGASAMGITIESYYLTIGHHDAVVISDAPDAATVAKFLLKMGASGRFSTETLTAFSEDEALAIAGDL